jgi:serine/threonine protein kinase, bacterial
MLERRRYAFCMPLASGTIYVGHTILRLQGCGGMGEVYFAHHLRLPRREPLKILSTDAYADNAYRRRFIGDADVAGPLAHPNIVCVSDRGESNRQLWISMVDGTDAATLLRDRRGNRSDRQRTRLCASAPRSNPQLVRPFRPRWPRKRLHVGRITIQSSFCDGP